MFNNCDNLHELTKFNYNYTPSLSQGIEFKQAQNKFFSKSNKNRGSNNIYASSFVEGFEGLNTNDYLGKIMGFIHDNTMDAAYVTDKGIIRKIEPGLIIDSCAGKMNSIIMVNAMLPSSAGVYIPELNLTTGEPMTKSDKCEILYPNDNMNLLGRGAVFIKNGQIAYVTNEGIVRLVEQNKIVENNAKQVPFAMGVYLDLEYPVNSPPGTNIPIINLKIGEPLPQDYKFPASSATIANAAKAKTTSVASANNNEVESTNVLVTNQTDIPPENKLATESNQIVQDSKTITTAEQLEQLRKDYDASLKQYQDLMDKINNNTQDYLKRTKNNPYLGKNIRFTDGTIAYVTQQGVVKAYTNPEIWDSVANKNGCPDKNFTSVNVKYKGVLGEVIPELNLIVGPFMKNGEACGNAGKNIYVNKLLDNPEAKYVGCYNDKAPSSDIQFVPIMNYGEVSKFFTQASSVWNNNDIAVWGAWAAFNRKDDPYWHSAYNSSTWYDNKTGNYKGTNQWWYWDDYSNRTGQQKNPKGEWIWLEYGPGFTLTKYELRGRQGCCGNPNGRTPNSWVVLGGAYNEGWFLVDKRDNTYSVGDGQNGYETRTFYVKNPRHYNVYVLLTTNVGHPGDRGNNRYCVQIAQWNLFTSSSITTGDGSRAMIWKPEFVNRTDFDTCKKYAAENGFKYFGLQDVQADGNAQCSVSNDLANTQKYGKGYNYKQQVLWHSNTGGGKGAMALLNDQGSLVVNNSSGAAVWSSPGQKGTPANYLGCYRDSGNRRLPKYLGDGKTYETCQSAAQSGNWKYFGLQYMQPNKTSECWVGNDLNMATSFGKASNCTKLSDSVSAGGGWSNAVYNNTEASVSSFLILQDDDNMVIYRGTGPSDNQGAIWATGTNSKRKDKNINFSAERSKFGRNWIPNGTTLAPGDFIGSNDGSIYLLMQTDGNLVLFTSERVDGCSVNSSGKQMGGSWMNAVYEFANSGFKDNIGKLGFVDENDTLYEYPSNNARLTQSYTKFDKYDAYGADLPSAAYGSATIEKCKTSCNNRNDCYGFAYDFQNNVCYPKSNAMWPYGGPSRPLDRVDTYIKNQVPISVPLGATNETISIDSAQYQFYNKGSPLPRQYGLINATESDKAELTRLQNKMKGLTNQISELINKFGSGTNNAQNQGDQNLNGLINYQTEMQKIENRIDTLNSTSDTTLPKMPESFVNYGYSANNNIEKIVQDSDIAVLQKNYEYLLWTILATGSVLVAMNINKN